MNLPTLNIIGAGRLGKTLAYLWHTSATFHIQAICNQSEQSAQAAIDFIQAGQAHTHIKTMPDADFWLISCADNDIQSCCEELISSRTWQGHETIFHCSGALTAQEVLNSASKQNLAIASIHPIKSFAEPQTSITSFAGTYCGIEGDQVALDLIQPKFEAIGANCFAINSEQKTLYHAASVIACNYLVSLQELSIQTYKQAGVSRTQAMHILEPIVKNTVDNIFKLGTQKALTGPIARGDDQTVNKQQKALNEWNVEYGEVYRLLGNVAKQLAPKNKTSG